MKDCVEIGSKNDKKMTCTMDRGASIAKNGPSHSFKDEKEFWKNDNNNQTTEIEKGDPNIHGHNGFGDVSITTARIDETLRVNREKSLMEDNTPETTSTTSSSSSLYIDMSMEDSDEVRRGNLHGIVIGEHLDPASLSANVVNTDQFSVCCPDNYQSQTASADQVLPPTITIGTDDSRALMSRTSSEVLAGTNIDQRCCIVPVNKENDSVSNAINHTVNRQKSLGERQPAEEGVIKSLPENKLSTSQQQQQQSMNTKVAKKKGRFHILEQDDGSPAPIPPTVSVGLSRSNDNKNDEDCSSNDSPGSIITLPSTARNDLSGCVKPPQVIPSNNFLSQHHITHRNLHTLEDTMKNGDCRFWNCNNDVNSIEAATICNESKVRDINITKNAERSNNCTVLPDVTVQSRMESLTSGLDCTEVKGCDFAIRHDHASDLSPATLHKLSKQQEQVRQPKCHASDASDFARPNATAPAACSTSRGNLVISASAVSKCQSATTIHGKSNRCIVNSNIKQPSGEINENAAPDAVTFQGTMNSFDATSSNEVASMPVGKDEVHLTQSAGNIVIAASALVVGAGGTNHDLVTTNSIKSFDEEGLTVVSTSSFQRSRSPSPSIVPKQSTGCLVPNKGRFSIVEQQQLNVNDLDETQSLLIAPINTIFLNNNEAICNCVNTSSTKKVAANSSAVTAINISTDRQLSATTATKGKSLAEKGTDDALGEALSNESLGTLTSFELQRELSLDTSAGKGNIVIAASAVVGAEHNVVMVENCGAGSNAGPTEIKYSNQTSNEYRASGLVQQTNVKTPPCTASIVQQNQNISFRTSSCNNSGICGTSETDRVTGHVSNADHISEFTTNCSPAVSPPPPPLMKKKGRFVVLNGISDTESNAKRNVTGVCIDMANDNCRAELSPRYGHNALSREAIELDRRDVPPICTPQKTIEVASHIQRLSPFSTLRCSPSYSSGDNVEKKASSGMLSKVMDLMDQMRDEALQTDKFYGKMQADLQQLREQNQILKAKCADERRLRENAEARVKQLEKIMNNTRV